VQFALSQVPAAKGSPLDRPTAGKTGTWQLGSGNKSGATGNAHTWMVGFVPPGADKAKAPGLATAVWIGNKKEEQALLKRDASKPTSKPTQAMFGSTMAAPTYRKFMATALRGTNTGRLPTEMVAIGDKDIGNGIEPTKAPDPTDTGGGPGGPGNGSPSPSISTRPGGGGGGGGPGVTFPPIIPPTKPRN